MFAGERWKSLRWKDNLKIVQVEWSQLGATRVHHKNQLFTPNLIRLLNKTGQTDTCHTIPVAILELAKWLAFPTAEHSKLTFCSVTSQNLIAAQAPGYFQPAFAKIEWHQRWRRQTNKCPKAFRAGPETVLLRSKSDRSWCLLTPSAVIAHWRATFCAVDESSEDGGAKSNLQISFQKSWN